MRKLIPYLNVESLRRLVASSLLGYFIYSYPTWMSDGFYQAYPAFDFTDIPLLRAAIRVFYGISLILILYRPLSRGILVFLFLAMGCWLVVDLNYFHPIMLQALALMLVPKQVSPKQIQRAISLVLSITLISCAVNRINPSYVYPFFSFFPFLSEMYVSILVILLTLIEFCLGILLLIETNRKYPAWILFGFFGFLVALLLTYGYTQEIIWIVFQGLLTVLILPLTEARPEFMIKFRHELRVFSGIYVLMFISLASFCGLINGTFSFQLYSGNSPSSIVIFDESKISLLEAKHRRYVNRLIDGTPYFDVGSLFWKEYHILLFPDPKNFLQNLKPLKQSELTDDEMVILIKTGHELEVGKGIQGYTKSDIP